MKPHDDLWRRLEGFRFDGDADDGRFVAKLARDNGWSPAHARCVVEEYRRYAYLACTAEHVVVPSEQVDQAWHQHLLDTQPYWDQFCRQILRRPLHHRPSKGGLADRQRHIELYEQTRASYERVFGHPPPRDIWPEASIRFGGDLRHRRVPLAEHWVVPKRPVLATATAVGTIIAAIAIAGAAPLYVGARNPLNFDGPSFLAFYGFLFVVALVAALYLRSRLLSDHERQGAAFADPKREEPLDPYEAATLQCNTRLAVNAAIAALERDGVLRVEERTERGLFFRSKQYRLVLAGPLAPDALPLESAVHEQVSRKSGGLRLNDVHEHLEIPAASLLASLQNRGLLVSPGSGPAKLGMVLPLLALAALGAVKVVVGLMRDRPIFGLIFLIVATLITAAVVASRARRTHRGTTALRAAEQRIGKRTKLVREEVVSGRELAWLVGLYGVTVLHGGSMTRLHAALTADAAHGGGAGATSTGGCGGGCGGGSGGDGCGGCGGD